MKKENGKRLVVFFFFLFLFRDIKKALGYLREVKRVECLRIWIMISFSCFVSHFVVLLFLYMLGWALFGKYFKKQF